MSRWKTMLAGTAILALGVAVGTAGTARAAAPFYEGKTITFVVGLGVGGGADVDCRFIAQFMGKYIAGNPTIIVKNMPSNDNLIAVNYVGRDAKNDGLSVLCGPYEPDAQLFHNDSLHVDLTKFNYITGDGSPDVAYMRADIPPGMKTGQDLFKVDAKALTVGGFAVDSLKDIYLRGILATMGFDHYTYVTGFAGGAQARAALQQKFINFWSENITGYAQVVIPALVKTGEAVPLFQTGSIDSADTLAARSPLLPDVPSFVEFYQSHFGKPPAGTAWELSKLILGMNDVALRAMALPPGAPPEAVAALRAAIGPLNQDPDFIAQSDKLRGAGTPEQSPELVQSQIKGFLAMKPDLLAYYKGLIASGQSMAQKR